MEILSDRVGDLKLIRQRRPSAREVRRTVVEFDPQDKRDDLSHLGILDFDQWLRVLRSEKPTPEIEVRTVRLGGTDIRVSLMMKAGKRRLPIAELRRLYDMFAMALPTQGNA